MSGGSAGAVLDRVREELVGQGVSRDLAALSATQSIAAFGAGMIIPLLAPLLAGLPDPMFPPRFLGIPVTTELQVGVLFSVFGIARSLLQVPMGRLSDRLGVRKLFLETGLVLSAVSLWAYGEVGTVGALVSVRLFQGFALAVSTPALFALVEGVTDYGTRGGSMGFFSTMRTLGWGMGPIVGGVITDLFGLGAAFAIGAALTLLAAVVVRLTVPEVRPGEGRTDDDAVGSGDGTAAGRDGDVTPESAPNGGRQPGEVLFVFSSRNQATTVLGLGLALVTLMMGFSAMVAMENPILERIGGTKAGFGLVFAISTITRLVVQFPVGIAADTYGRKRFIVGGLVLSAPLVGLMGFAHGLWEFVLLRGLLGMALAGVIAPAYALAADVVDDRRSGEQMGVITAAFSVGFAVGPITSGLVAFMGFAVPFLLAAALTVVGAAAVWLLVDETGDFESPLAAVRG